jgi:hypothetical protein
VPCGIGELMTLTLNEGRERLNPKYFSCLLRRERRNILERDSSYWNIQEKILRFLRLGANPKEGNWYGKSSFFKLSWRCVNSEEAKEIAGVKLWCICRWKRIFVGAKFKLQV